MPANCDKCGGVKITKTYNHIKRGTRSTTFCPECKKVRDREHIKSRTPEKNKEVCDKYRRSDKGKAAILRKRQELIEATRLSKVGKSSAIEYGLCKMCSSRYIYNPKSSLKLRDIRCNVCISAPGVKIGICNHSRMVNCKDCNSLFISKKAGSRCLKCKKKAADEWKSKAPRDHNILRRAKRMGVEVSKVSRDIVYKRDNYMCWICDTRVVRSKTYRPDQASLDHIVPLSKGGAHSYDNIKTCCVMCNSKKGATIIPQSNSSSRPGRSCALQLSLW